MKTTLVLAAALVLTGAAAASTVNPPWTLKDIKTAVRAVGYPKPHPLRLGCKGLGAATTSGAYTSFRCTARYRHHVRRRFFVEGKGEGGWLCAGKTLAGCKLLRRGFLTAATVGTQGLAASVDIAARGYMMNHYGSYQATGFCKQTASLSWSCPFVEATVTLTLRKAKGGYVSVGSVA